MGELGEQTIKNHRTKRALYSVARFRGAIELGWYDFITRFRRAFFGPLWITFQLAAWIGVIALILHDALGESFSSYVIYLGIGFYLWEFISSALGEGPGNFTSKAVLIKSVPVDLSYITVRKISFLFSRSLFQIPVPLILILALGEVEKPLLLLLLLPLPFLLACFAYAILILFGIIGAFYRDVEFLNASVLRFLFFTSPIFWRGDTGIRQVIAQYNPISYFLDIARAPFEGRAPAMLSWVIVATISMGGLLIAIWAQSRFRNRLIYWL